MRGCLIAIEGINGSGKSTIVARLQKQLRAAGHDVSVYKFPDRAGCRGREIDRYLLGVAAFPFRYDMFAAFAANRAAARASIIKDLDAGRIVICDRYIASAIAYHIPSTARDHSLAAYQQVIGHFDKPMLVPDLTYLIAGHHLHLRRERAQLFHYDDQRAAALFETFKKIVPMVSLEHQVVYNEPDRQGETAAYIVNDILKWR